MCIHIDFNCLVKLGENSTVFSIIICRFVRFQMFSNSTFFALCAGTDSIWQPIGQLCPNFPLTPNNFSAFFSLCSAVSTVWPEEQSGRVLQTFSQKSPAAKDLWVCDCTSKTHFSVCNVCTAGAKRKMVEFDIAWF